jgi:hypothetical protein
MQDRNPVGGEKGPLGASGLTPGPFAFKLSFEFQFLDISFHQILIRRKGQPRHEASAIFLYCASERT